jgi:hypothetical protein
MTATPRAVAVPDGSNPLQPAIDQLLDAQQQITQTDSTFPFIVPSDLATLHDYEQMVATTMLGSEFNIFRNQLGDVVVPWATYSWDANAAEPQAFLVYNNPDDFYSVLEVDPGKTYVVTVDPGPGTQDVTFLPNAGNGVTSEFHPLSPLDLANATPDADGDYTITLSATPQPDNWVDTAGAQVVIIRDTLGDWGEIHDSFSIQEQGGPQTLTLPVLSENQMSSMLGTIAANLPTESASGSYYGQVHGVDTVAVNTFSSIAPTTEHIPGPLLSDQLTSLGHFSLQPDQALIVTVPDIDAAYSSIMLANDWGETDPFATVSGSLNDTQAFHDPDGYTYYVISSQDPGVANWVDDSGIDNGGVWLRWQDVTGPIPSTGVQTEVVDIADVRSDLPADTPVITPAEYATEFKDRLFDYDYAHDQDHGISWVGANLMYDQVKTAMGTQQFDEIFGSQQDVPSVLDRLTPALSPDLATLAHDIVTNPAGSLSAIVNNVPLAVKDIELPGILAMERLSVLAGQVHSGISSHDLSATLAALGSGVQGLATIVDETWTDPATSITAGILNARDDLAVAVMNAPSGWEPLSESAPLWDSLINLNQAALDTLIHPADSIALLGLLP